MEICEKRRYTVLTAEYKEHYKLEQQQQKR